MVQTAFVILIVGGVFAFAMLCATGANDVSNAVGTGGGIKPSLSPLLAYPTFPDVQYLFPPLLSFSPLLLSPIYFIQ